MNLGKELKSWAWDCMFGRESRLNLLGKIVIAPWMAPIVACLVLFFWSLTLFEKGQQ